MSPEADCRPWQGPAQEVTPRCTPPSNRGVGGALARPELEATAPGMTKSDARAHAAAKTHK